MNGTLGEVYPSMILHQNFQSLMCPLKNKENSSVRRYFFKHLRNMFALRKKNNSVSLVVEKALANS